MASDIVFNSTLLNIAHASEDFSNAPEVTLRVALAKVWERLEEQV